MEMKNVADNKKTAHLIPKVRMDMYKKIRDLCAPVKPKYNSFDDIVSLVKGQINPKRNEAMECCKFQQAKQSPSESIAVFIERLRELALHCNFKNLDAALRD